MKRFRMTAQTSAKALHYADKVLPKIGDVRLVRAIRFTSAQTSRYSSEGVVHKSIATMWREYLYVIGEHGSVRFNGVCWGYRGEGPRSLYEILVACGIKNEQAISLAFNSNRLNKDGISWEFNLENNEITKAA